MKTKKLVLVFSSLLLAVFFSISTSSYAGENLIPGDSSFETGYGVWKKAGSLDDTTAFDGKHSVKAKGNIRTWERFSLKAGKPYTFSCYLKSDIPRGLLLRAARTNWRGHAESKRITLSKEWKRYEMSIPAQKINAHRTVWLAIEGCSGTYWVDACQLEEGELTDYQSAEPVSVISQIESPVEGNIFYPEEEIKIRFNFYNSQKKEEAVNLSYKIKDYDEKIVKLQTISLKLKPKESLFHQISLGRLKKKGFYLLSYNLSDKKGVISKKEASFCVVARPLPYSVEEGSLFGVTAKQKRIQACERIGVKWCSTNFLWSKEEEKGRINEGRLDNLSKFVDYIKEHNMNVCGYLRRTARWAAIEPRGWFDRCPPKDDCIDGYGDYVYRIVNRFKDRIKVWQCWGGEIDGAQHRVAGRLGKSEDWFVDMYTKMVKAGYKGAKRADPECIWGACSVSGVDCDWSRNFHLSRKIFKKAGDYIDEFAIHPYCWPRDIGEGKKVQSPEEHRLDKIYKNAFSFSQKPLWNSEYGFALSLNEKIDSPSAKMLADYMARSFILTASIPQVKRIIWYSCWNCDEGGSNYDMWRWPNPLPVVAAYSALAQVLTGARSPQEIPMGSYIKAYSFEKEKGSLVALWVPADKEVKIEIRRIKGIRVIDIMGNEVKKKGKLKLTGSPLYLLSDMAQESLTKIVQQAKIDLKPVNAELRLADSKTLKVYLTNQLNTELTGKIKLSAPLEIEKDFIGLRPGITELIEISLPEKINRSGLVEGKVETNKGEVKVSQNLSLIPCLKISKKIEIDGDLREWKDRDFIELKDASFLAPPDALAHNLWTGEGDLSIKAYLAWDEKRFYFAARVKDDIFINKSGKERIWSGDSIQIAFDPENDALRTEASGYEDDDKEFSFGYSQKLNKPCIYQYWPIPPVEPKAELAVKREGNYIFCELALPFKALRPLKPEDGKVFGFNFIIFDCDHGKRSHYWLGLTSGIAGGKDPSAFKKFILLKK